MNEADVSELTFLRENHKLMFEKEGIKLTFMPYLVKAVALCLKEHPYLNASMESEDIVLKKYYNIGVAIDSEDGLFVPVVKGAQDKDIKIIAKEIEKLISDNENNFSSIGNINGIFVQNTTSKDGDIERNIRYIKEKLRALVTSLPFNMCSYLLKEAIKYSTTMINLLPRESGVSEYNSKVYLPAREALMGYKLDYKQLTLKFGSYCEVYNNNHAINKNSIIKPRTLACIALKPLLNGFGSWIFHCLATNRTIESNKFQELPMPTELIYDIDKLYKDEKNGGKNTLLFNNTKLSFNEHITIIDNNRIKNIIPDNNNKSKDITISSENITNSSNLPTIDIIIPTSSSSGVNIDNNNNNKIII
jgi:hypothetical protein